jgi:hypothetical protein
MTARDQLDGCHEDTRRTACRILWVLACACPDLARRAPSPIPSSRAEDEQHKSAIAPLPPARGPRQTTLPTERRPETRAGNWSDVAQNSGNCATEIPQRLANSWEYRGRFCEPEIAYRDRAGWLGRQDSNLCISESELLGLASNASTEQSLVLPAMWTLLTETFFPGPFRLPFHRTWALW